MKESTYNIKTDIRVQSIQQIQHIVLQNQSTMNLNDKLEIMLQKLMVFGLVKYVEGEARAIIKLM